MFAKELRVLAVPAAALVALMIVPMAIAYYAVAPDTRYSLLSLWTWTIQVSVFAFVFGSVVLGALPMGTEFQHRTMALLLSTPAPRRQHWVSKHAALLIVLGAMALAAYVAIRMGGTPRYPLSHVSFLVMVFSSCALWTLVARSTIGGAVFTLAGIAMTELTASWIVGRLAGTSIVPFTSHPALWVVHAVYIGATAWLGWRTFARLEVTGQPDGGRLDEFGIPGAFAVLRPRARGRLANLVRKEIRLQQPAFLVAGLFAACWMAAVAIVAASPLRPGLVDAIFTVLLVSYFPLIILIAATISVSEERALGIHAWHLTLPASSSLQWGMKLAVTACVVAALALAWPAFWFSVANPLLQLPSGALQLPSWPGPTLLAAGLSVLCFWAATLFGSTVKAGLAAGLTLAGLAICASIGGWLGAALNPVSGLMTSVMVHWQLTPDSFYPIGSRRPAFMLEQGFVVAGLAVLSVLALRQSLLAFRSAQHDARRIVRHLAALALLAVAMSFASASYLRGLSELFGSPPLREMEEAVRRVAVANVSEQQGISLTVGAEELAATGALSDTTRRWLTDASVEISARARPRGPSFVLAELRMPNGRIGRSLVRLEPRQ